MAIIVYRRNNFLFLIATFLLAIKLCEGQDKPEVTTVNAFPLQLCQGDCDDDDDVSEYNRAAISGLNEKISHSFGFYRLNAISVLER
jgi:hypothetical protein